MSATAASIACCTPASDCSSLTKTPTQEGSSARAVILSARMSSAAQMEHADRCTTASCCIIEEFGSMTTQRELVSALGELLPQHSILWRTEDTRPYECDGLMLYRQLPMIVVLPETEVEVAQVLRLCHAREVPVVPRGAGTGLSGRALPPSPGVPPSLAEVNRILTIHPRGPPAPLPPAVRNPATGQHA